MAVTIPTRIAIYVMAGIAVVYFIVTVVLILVCIGCFLYHRQPKKAPGAASQTEGASQLEEERDSGEGMGEETLSTTGSWMLDSQPSRQVSRLGLDKQEAESEGSRSGSRLSPSPRLPKNVVLPPLEITPHLPALTLPLRGHKHHFGEDRDSRAEGTSTLPRIKHASGEFKVLTVHKSTLKRKRTARIEPAQDSISETDTDTEYTSENSKDSIKIRPLKEMSRRPRVARTESTKPLVEDDESPESEEQITGSIMWSGTQVPIKEVDWVLENMNTQEEDDGHSSLTNLQSDIMEMITAL